jgi:hypothetical protein
MGGTAAINMVTETLIYNLYKFQFHRFIAGIRFSGSTEESGKQKFHPQYIVHSTP